MIQAGKWINFRLDGITLSVYQDVLTLDLLEHMFMVRISGRRGSYEESNWH